MRKLTVGSRGAGVKVVLDTMLWVSYCTLKDGYRHRLIERARRKRVRFFVSAYILAELETVLKEDFDLTSRFASLSIRAVLRIANLVDLPQKPRSFVPGDSEDNSIVQTAFASKADYLVTADKEILKVGRVEDIEIITPQDWEELL
jgi:putative PIN family toxin of toxin-antitoxin system